MTQDPLSLWDEPGGSLDDFLGDGPPSSGFEIDILLTAEPEELRVIDAEGRLVGVIDLS